MEFSRPEDCNKWPYPSPGDLPNPRINPRSPHCRQILYKSHQRSPRILEWVAYPFSSGSSRPRNETGVFCIAGSLYQLSYQRSPQNIKLSVVKVSVTQLCLTLCDLMDCCALESLSLEFWGQEYWSGLLFPSEGDLPDLGIEPRYPTLQVVSLPSESPAKDA